MAQTVVRAAQNTYDTSVTGGTRDIADNGRDITVFVDSLRDLQEDTAFLNSLTKGPAGDQMIERTGKHQLMPRGTTISAAVLAAATTLPIVPGHGFRFQQMAVLQVTNATGDSEIMWVNADPLADSISVKRAQGGTTALAFAAGDKVKVIGHATPQNADFPLAPITSGTHFWNTYQTFSGHLEISDFADISPTLEWGGGSNLARQMKELAEAKRRELNDALLLGRRQVGSPDPSNPIPSFMGGMVGYAELAGNRYTVAGSAPLTIDFLVESYQDLDQKYGNAMGRRALVSPATSLRLHKIAAPANYERPTSNGTLDLRFNRVQTNDGDIQFATQKGLPDGKIFVYQDNNHNYGPFKGKDWKEKEVPTMGDHKWRGMSGTFTYRPKHPDAYAIIDGFSMDLSAYPDYVRSV